MPRLEEEGEDFSGSEIKSGNGSLSLAGSFRKSVRLRGCRHSLVGTFLVANNPFSRSDDLGEQLGPWPCSGKTADVGIAAIVGYHPTGGIIGGETKCDQSFVFDLEKKTNFSAGKELEDVIDASAVRSGVHMEAIEAAVIDAGVDKLKLGITNAV